MSDPPGVLTPATFPLLVRHLDAIDEAVADRAAWLWNEEPLTTLLCDLLDEAHQPAYRLSYSIADLRAELAATAPLVDARVTVRTHRYNAAFEHLASQADLGLVLEIRDDVLPQRSAAFAVLLQAKRLYPAASGRHGPGSAFGGYDAAQEERIDRLRGVLGTDAVQHLLYCPRGAALPSYDGRRLAHMRAAAVTDDIFDHTHGQALRAELIAGPDAFDAGVFVAAELRRSTTLRHVHEGLFTAATPLSWFVAAALARPRRPYAAAPVPVDRSGGAAGGLLRGIVEAQPDAIGQVLTALELGPRTFTFLPAHTITISLAAGADSAATDR